MLHPMLTIATQAARSAGRLIVRFLDQLDQKDISEKSLHDYVTKADKLAEQEIIQHIRRHYPHHAILAEESGAISNPESNERFTWIIDPLDGTMNFIHGIPHFAISIALKMDNRLEVGLVYDPIKDELFTAARGKGAHFNNRRIRIQNRSKLDQALVGTGFPHTSPHLFPKYLRQFEAITPACAGVRRMGSAALDLAYVAAGRLDAYWEMGLNSWDIAAGALLVLEAGGIVSDFEGKDQYLERGEIVVGNTKMHAALLELIGPSPA